MAKQYRATAENVRDYWQLFVNRRAYVVQSPRPHPESGRHYYFRPKAGKAGEPLSLTEAIVRQHLEGRLTIGLYAMNPETQRSKWIAIDGDYNDALKHLCELQWELQTADVEAALEMSRRGAHLDTCRAIPPGAGVPIVDYRRCGEARNPGERFGDAGRDRDFPEA